MYNWLRSAALLGEKRLVSLSLLFFLWPSLVQAAPGDAVLRDPRVGQLEEKMQQVVTPPQSIALIKHNVLGLVEARNKELPYCFSQYQGSKDHVTLNTATLQQWEQMLDGGNVAVQNGFFNAVLRNIELRTGNLKERIAATGIKFKNFDLMNPSISTTQIYSQFQQSPPSPFDALTIGSSSQVATSGPQGGPYVPVTEPMRYNFSKALDNLLLLEDIHKSLPLGIPLPNSRMTSGFGIRKDPINRKSSKHLGLDFTTSNDPTVYSTAEGTVIFAGRAGEYGNKIIIEHGYGITTQYAHLRKILVVPGQKVGLFQPIGIEGNTGRTTGTHLHYEIRIHDIPQDPARFLLAAQRICNTDLPGTDF